METEGDSSEKMETDDVADTEKQQEQNIKDKQNP